MFNYDPAQVRPKFRAHYCHALTLPSGELCDYELYPITDDEIRNLTKDLDQKPDYIGERCFATESEWLLWTALRLKYGLNYFTESTRHERIVEYYEPQEPAQPSPFDYIDFRMEMFVDEFINRQITKHKEEEKQQEKKNKKSKKYIDFDLTGEENYDIVFTKEPEN